MLSKETKARIRRNAYARLQRRQVNFLRKYFIGAFLIPLPFGASARGLKHHVLSEMRISEPVLFRSPYAIGVYPADMQNPNRIYGQFIRSQRDPSFCTFGIKMDERLLFGLSAPELKIDLVERRKQDMARKDMKLATVQAAPCKFVEDNLKNYLGNDYYIRDHSAADESE
jgi:hypothetical protein